MAQSTDFLLDSNNDFPLEDTIINGVIYDTPYGISDSQHIRDNIEYTEGSLLYDPIIGFGVKRYLNSEYFLYKITKELKQKMSLDRYKVLNGCVSLNKAESGGGFTIDTSYIVSK